MEEVPGAYGGRCDSSNSDSIEDQLRYERSTFRERSQKSAVDGSRLSVRTTACNPNYRSHQQEATQTWASI